MSRRPITEESEIPDIFNNRDNGVKSRCTSAEIELRRLEVARRRLRGEPVSRIADDLGFSAVTIRNDVEAIAQSKLQYIINFKQDDFVSESLGIFKAIENESFRQYESVPIGDSRRSKFLMDARVVRKDMISLMQESGLLHKEPKKIDVKVGIEVIKDWTPEQRQLVASSVVDAAILDVVEAKEFEKDPYAEAKSRSDNIDVDEIAEYMDE